MGRSPLPEPAAFCQASVKSFGLGSSSRPPETSLGKPAEVGRSCQVREGPGSVQRKAPSRPQGPRGPTGLHPEVLLTRKDPSENQSLGVSPGTPGRGKSPPILLGKVSFTWKRRAFGACPLPQKPKRLECLEPGPAPHLPTFPRLQHSTEGRLPLRGQFRDSLCRRCQMLGCKSHEGLPEHTSENGPPNPRVRAAPARGWGWPQRGGLRGSSAASSPLKYPDFIDGRQGGRHVGLKVSVVHPGLAESPRRRVVLPVVMPVPLTVCPEAI